MSSCGEDSGVAAERPKARLIAYGLVLLQALAMVGFLLPWYKRHDALLMKVWSDLTHVSSEAAKDLGISLIACFIVMAAALTLAVYAIGPDIRRTRSLNISFLLESLAIAGPLMYFQAMFHEVQVWSDASYWFGLMGLGWYMTLLCSVGACVLALHLFNRQCVTARTRPVPDCGPPERSKMTISAMIIAAALISGVIIAVVGYFMAWRSGTVFTMFSSTTVSRTGADEAPLMFLVPVTSILALALALTGELFRDRIGPILVSSAQCVLVTGLTFTVFWGVIIGDWVLTSRSVWGEYSLQSGWYICVLGQVLALACVMLSGRIWSPPDA